MAEQPKVVFYSDPRGYDGLTGAMHRLPGAQGGVGRFADVERRDRNWMREYAHAPRTPQAGIITWEARIVGGPLDGLSSADPFKKFTNLLTPAELEPTRRAVEYAIGNAAALVVAHQPERRKTSSMLVFNPVTYWQGPNATLEARKAAKAAQLDALFEEFMGRVHNMPVPDEIPLSRTDIVRELRMMGKPLIERTLANWLKRQRKD